MTHEQAPVAVFAYRRPDHLTRCLAALGANPEASATRLVIFCDGPKSPAEADAVSETRKVARNVQGFAYVDVVESESNQGLANSLIAGVSEVVDEAGEVIVVEDDLVVSEDFLAYMNQGLAAYREDPRVASIHGFLPKVDRELPQSFFLRGADCWGWATWKRAWSAFNPDGAALLAALREHPDRSAFDFKGAYPYLDMLERQVRGEVDSWAIRWYASAFLADMYTLYPGVSLVANIGMEGSGTHAGRLEALEAQAARFSLPLRRIPVSEYPRGREAVAAALGTSSRTWATPITRFLQRLSRGGTE